MAKKNKTDVGRQTERGRGYCEKKLKFGEVIGAVSKGATLSRERHPGFTKERRDHVPVDSSVRFSPEKAVHEFVL